MGAACAQLVLSHAADGLSPADYATMRHASAMICRIILVPSLALVLVSGLFAMAARKAFMNAGWAWIKAGLTFVVFEGTLMAVSGPTQVAAKVSAEIAAGDPTHAVRLTEVVSHERGGLVVVLLLSVVNIALAVWRPRSRRRRASTTDTAVSEAAPAAPPEEPVAS